MRVVDVRAQETAALFWSCAYFFCLLSSYYVLRPLRETMGSARGLDELRWLYMGTLTATLLATPLFGALVSRFPRRRFIPITYRFFTANILLFFALLARTSIGRNPMVERSFFVWLSVFNLFVVSVFWGFMADLWTSEQGKRLFGFIGLGGTLGGVLGAGATAALSRALGPVNMLLVSAALLEASLLGVRRLVRISAAVPSAAATSAAREEPLAKTGALGGFVEVARSPYLLAICLYMLFYTLTSTFVYFEQARIVKGAFGDDAAGRAGAFAQIDLFVNMLTVVLQCFATGRILRAIGVGKTLAVLPVVTLGGFAALAGSARFAVIAAFQVLRRGTDYSLTRPAREVLYTVVPREEKYKAKTFIDTFVYRGGDLIGAWLSALLDKMQFGAGGLALLVAPLSLAWVGVGAWLGSRHSERARGPGAAASHPAPAEASRHGRIA